MTQLTREQAIEFAKSGAWTRLSLPERAVFQMEQEYWCMPFSAFHEAIEATLGRPVFTHEFGLNRDGLKAELAGGKAPTFEEVLALIPADKLIVVAT